MQVTLLKPGTTGGTVTFDSQNYRFVTFTAPALATTETCTVGVYSPDSQPVAPAVTIDGTAVNKLTASIQSQTWVGGPVYSLTLSATVASCGLYADVSPRA